MMSYHPEYSIFMNINFCRAKYNHQCQEIIVDLYYNFIIRLQSYPVISIIFLIEKSSSPKAWVAQW